MDYQQEKRILERKGPLTSEEDAKVVLKRGGEAPIINLDQIEVHPRDTYQQSELATGRKMFLGIAITLLIIQCLDVIAYVAMPGELVAMGVSGDPVSKVLGSLFWVIFSGVLLFNMYKGRMWAKVVILIRLGVGALGTSMITVSTPYSPTEYVLGTLLISAVLITFFFLLILNKNVTKFFSYQNKLRKNIPVEIIPDLSMQEKYGDGSESQMDTLEDNPVLQKKQIRGKIGFIGLSLIIVGSQIGYLISTAIVQGIYAYDVSYTALLFLSGIVGVLMRGIALWFLYRGVLWLKFVVLTFAIVQTLYTLIAVFPPATENLFLSMIVIESLLLVALWVFFFLLITPSSVRIFVEGQKNKIAYNAYKKEKGNTLEDHPEYKIQDGTPEKRGQKWLARCIFIYGVVAIIQSFVAMMSYYEYAVYYSINPWGVIIEIFNPILTLGVLWFVWKSHKWAKYVLVIVTLGLLAHSLYFISKGEVLLNQILTMIPILSLVVLTGIILFNPSVQAYFQSLNLQDEGLLKARDTEEF